MNYDGSENQTNQLEADRSANALFGVRDVIVAPLGGPPLEAFCAYLRDGPVRKFMILTDYCFHRPYPNDVFVYSVVKGDHLLPSPQEFAALKGDLKDVSDLDPVAISFLRDSRLFTFALALQPKAKVHATRELMLKSMDTSLAFHAAWENAADHQEAIKNFKGLRIEAESPGFNSLLYDRMLLASIFAALISALIVEHNPVPVDAVGWFSDRDAIVEKATSLASHLCNTILNEYCTESGLALPPTVSFVDHRNPELAPKSPWFDPFIRVADYFAGALAEINYKAVAVGEPLRVTSTSHAKVISEVIADNPNVVVLCLDGKAPPFTASIFKVSKSPLVSETDEPGV